MTAKVVDLSGKLIEDGSCRGLSARDVLLLTLAEIDAGTISPDRVIMIMAQPVGDRDGCDYFTRASDMTINEAHTLLALGAQMKLNLLMGRE